MGDSMFTKRGEDKVNKMTARAIRLVTKKSKRHTADEVYAWIRDQEAKIAKRHEEVYDTEVREGIWAELNAPFIAVYGHEFDDYRIAAGG